MALNTRTYIDLDFNFTAHPLTGDIARKFDEEAIKQSLKALIMTKNYERLFHPEIGSQADNLLFDNITPLTRTMLEATITNMINNFEPRIQLLRVNVIPNNDENMVDISILYRLANTQSPVSVDFTLQRTR